MRLRFRKPRLDDGSQAMEALFLLLVLVTILVILR